MKTHIDDELVGEERMVLQDLGILEWLLAKAMQQRDVAPHTVLEGIAPGEDYCYITPRC